MEVSEYNVTRHYGGPEEGGWWYDRHEFVRVIMSTDDEEAAFARARALNAEARENKEQPDGKCYQGRFSVADPTDKVFYVDREPRENDNMNEPRPHYC